MIAAGYGESAGAPAAHFRRARRWATESATGSVEGDTWCTDQLAQSHVCLSVEEFARDVQVARVPSRLLDHVQDDPTHIRWLGA